MDREEFIKICCPRNCDTCGVIVTVRNGVGLSSERRRKVLAKNVFLNTYNTGFFQPVKTDVTQKMRAWCF